MQCKVSAIHSCDYLNIIIGEDSYEPENVSSHLWVFLMNPELCWYHVGPFPDW